MSPKNLFLNGSKEKQKLSVHVLVISWCRHHKKKKIRKKKLKKLVDKGSSLVATCHRP